MTSVSDSQGVQVGSGNVMYNGWTGNPVADLASLRGVSLRAAVARLRPLSHDELVGLFAAASPDDAVEVTRALLAADEPKVVAVLADLSPRKVAELTGPLAAEFPWLADLSAAAEGIASHALALGWADDHEAGRIERAPWSPGDKTRFLRVYGEGVIYWSDDGARAVSLEVTRHHAAEGGTCGPLGYPLLAAEETVSLQGTRGTVQAFEGGTVCSSDLGTYTLSGRTLRAYRSAGGACGWLGYPAAVPGPRDGAEAQRFEGGLIFSCPLGAFPVRHEVAACAEGWLPDSPEAPAGRSPVSRVAGTVQKFRAVPGGRMSIYSSPATGVHRVDRHIADYYEARGGAGSGLGFPVSRTAVEMTGSVQAFEGGRVYARLGSRFVTVPALTIELLARDSRTAGRLGWPLSEEQPVGMPSAGRVQFFEHGTVTAWEGRREIWLRP